MALIYKLIVLESVLLYATPEELPESLWKVQHFYLNPFGPFQRTVTSRNYYGCILRKMSEIPLYAPAAQIRGKNDLTAGHDQTWMTIANVGFPSQ